MTLSYFISQSADLLDDELYLKSVLSFTDNPEIKQFIETLLKEQEEKEDNIKRFYHRARHIILGD